MSVPPDSLRFSANCFALREKTRSKDSESMPAFWNNS